MENGIFNLLKSADLLFSVDSVISVAKSSSFVVLVSFVVNPLLCVLCDLEANHPKTLLARPQAEVIRRSS